jgi:diguanylate cyclase (GGDEF)-like protein
MSIQAHEATMPGDERLETLLASERRVGAKREISGRVLIADDDPDFRRMLVRRAERMGLDITEVSDGSKALAALKNGGFDVLILDLYMPGNTGLEVFQAARRIDPEIQALVLTGNATVETAVDALRSGAYDYLVKPLESLAVFELSLTRALEHRLLLRENARLFAEVERLAITDPLTGLFNRHKLNESLAVEVERGLRYARPLAAIMIDLDDLKRINDRHGHPVGDLVLREVAQGIKSQVRKVDIPTRYGGDEFLVLLPEADVDEATRVANRIFSRIKEIPFEGELPVSASIGVAELSPDDETPESFLHEVDRALYKSKRAGGGCIHAAPSRNGHG